MQEYIIQGAVIPIVILVVKWFLARSNKQHEDRATAFNKAIDGIISTQNELIKKIDTVEEFKASKADLDKINQSIKELWDTFREDQKDQSKQIGYLEGRLKNIKQD